MFNVGSITNENNKKHNKKWPFIRDRPYRILITDGSGSGKSNALLNLTKGQDDINKIYLYAKDQLSEPKYELLIKKREDAGIKYLDDPNAFIEFSNSVNNVYKNIDDYNPNRKRKILIVFDDILQTLLRIKNFKP